MKKRWLLPVLVMALLLGGCAETAVPDTGTPVDTTLAAETAVPATVPADGDAGDVTCKGSYTGAATEAVVAVSGTSELTGGQLQVWYWGEVSRYRQENHDVAPDFERPLDTQVCEIDSSVNSWQQYFLKQALSSWHTAQSLVQHSEDVPLTFEEAYQPNRDNTEKYMTGMPASEVLYGYDSHYSPNSMHQAYLDNIPEMLKALALEKGYRDVEEMAEKAFGVPSEVLEAYAVSNNRAYMYFTHLSHYIEPTAEELDAFCAEQGISDSGEISVDFRQILLIPQDVMQEDNRPDWQKRNDPLEPVVVETVTVAADGSVSCSEKAWQLCETQAQAMLTGWRKDRGTEATFAETAHKYSRDTGTQVNGGRYQGIRKGQMISILDAWCFDPARQVGDTAILRSEYGVHILYFSGSRTLAREAAEAEYYRRQQNALIATAKETYPMEVRYSDITLPDADGSVSAGDLLYPDIAHERFPEVPLYLQQDYPKTMYGGFKIRTNGCGITSFAMLASYMTDNELTPPEMCAEYGRYSHSNGTDGMLFNIEPAVLGFYMKEKTYDNRLARAALEEGHIVISVQHPGYWTTAGHYIVCENINDEGLVQVRDSNIYNYSRIRSHAQDVHKWGHIIEDGSGYWIFDYKITRIPACSRCGAPDQVTENLLNQAYLCEKCGPALLRRETYMDA